MKTRVGDRRNSHLERLRRRLDGNPSLTRGIGSGHYLCLLVKMSDRVGFAKLTDLDRVNLILLSFTGLLTQRGFTFTCHFEPTLKDLCEQRNDIELPKIDPI